MAGFIDPTREAFAAFRAADREGPIHMLDSHAGFTARRSAAPR